MKKVKITVLRTEFYAEYADAYLTEGRDVGPCPFHEVGQVLIFEGSAKMPEGFCPWAWHDLYGAISAISAGATYDPWYNSERMQIGCCTDGIRPVIFKIEAIGEEIVD